MIKNKENFIKFCKQTIHRDGIDDLLEWLDQTDFSPPLQAVNFMEIMQEAYAHIPLM